MSIQLPEVMNDKDVPDKLEFAGIDEAIGTFVEMRNLIRERKHVWDTEEKAKKLYLEKIQMWLRDKADELGVDSFNSRMYGTAYRAVKTSYRVGNWELFIDWVKENNLFHCLEKRCAKLAVKEVHELNGEVPPGLEYHTEVEMDVRSPKK